MGGVGGRQRAARGRLQHICCYYVWQKSRFIPGSCNTHCADVDCQTSAVKVRPGICGVQSRMGVSGDRHSNKWGFFILKGSECSVVLTRVTGCCRFCSGLLWKSICTLSCKTESIPQYRIHTQSTANGMTPRMVLEHIAMLDRYVPMSSCGSFVNGNSFSYSA